MGWTASAFGDLASSANGNFSVSPGVLHASGAMGANAAAAMSRAAQITASTNKVVAQTAALGQFEKLVQTAASVYVRAQGDIITMRSLQLAATSLFPPGVSDATVCGIMLFTNMLQDPVAMSATKDAATAAVKGAASATSVVTSALYTAAGQTGYALGWFVWNVLIHDKME